jgi:hypothetical protein
MVNAGASTFGWRSNNMGEIGQGSVLNEMRSMHPLQFFSELQGVTYATLSTLADQHKTWRAQSHAQPVVNLVPHGVKLYNEHNLAASRCTVDGIGATARVTYRDPVTGTAHPARLVDPVKKECECLLWQDLKFPCKCAIALAGANGTAANVYAAATADPSYRLMDVELAQIVSGPPALRPVLAPGPDELAARNTGVLDILDDLDEQDGLGIAPSVLPPPKRLNEQHGNRKRKRKESAGSAASTGRTKTASYAAAAASGGGAPARRTGACAICTRAGRFDVEAHKASMCPWGLPDVDAIDIITVSDDSDDNIPLAAL